MAHLRFSVPKTSEFNPKIWETAYITGIEGIPWLCEHSISEDQFSIARQIDESGKLNIVWPTRTLGCLSLTTTSLRLTDEPYILSTELARGTVYRLQTQIADWQRVGLRVSDEVTQQSQEALELLLRSLTCSHDRMTQENLAQSCIELSLRAIMSLSDAFSLQALEARRNSEGKMATLLGCRVEPSTRLEQVGDAVKTAFNLVSVNASLKELETKTGKADFSSIDPQVEWAIGADQKLCIGPMVDFRDGGLPDWMALLDDGFESVLNSACEHVQRVVERYRGKAHLWNCATGINVPSRLGWNDEESLRMAVALIETVRRTDARSPVLLTVDQPWSEYLRYDAEGVSPVHFADALIRADLGLSGLALELNLDRWPGGSFPRDPIEVNRLIDRWAMLGLPLLIILTSPTGSNHADPCCVSAWHEPEQDDEPAPSADDTLGPGVMQSLEEEGHVRPETLVRLLLSKPAVHAVVWDTLVDSKAPGESRSGLWKSDGKAKPLLATMAKLRKTCLH